MSTGFSALSAGSHFDVLPPTVDHISGVGTTARKGDPAYGPTSGN